MINKMLENMKNKIKRDGWRLLAFHGIGIIALVVSVVCGAYLLQTSVSGVFDLHYASTYYQANPFVLKVNLLILGGLGVILTLLGGSWYVGAALNLLVTGGLAYASLQKMAARGEPLYPSELSMISNARELLDMVNKKQVTLIIIGLVVIIGLAILVHVVGKRLLHLRRQGLKVYGLRIVGVLLMVLAMSPVYVIGSKYNKVHTVIADRGYYNYSWNQTQNYQHNGFVLGWLYNSTAPKMSKPSGYSKAAITRIVKKYDAQAKVANKTATALPKNLNVNVILSESLTDLDYPDIQKYFSFSSDPQPFLTKLATMKNAYVGDFISDQYGGGTANVEYEVLTGMNNYFLSTSAYQSIVPNTTSYPSVAASFKKRGDVTTALHAYKANMYKRSINYPKLGIETFLTLPELKNLKADPYGQYTTDQSLFNNLYSQWRKNSNKGQFNLTLTMQNHMPYVDNANNPNPKFPITVTGKAALKSIDKTKYSLSGLTHYANSAKLTDEALENLYNKVQKQKQPTLVVLFGDHRPGGIIDFLRDQDAYTGHKTPVVYFANFKLSKSVQNAISPNYTVANMYKLANFKRNGFTQLQLALEKQVPVLTQPASKLANGKAVTDRKQLQKLTTFREYEMINYDLNYGKRYAENMGFFK